MAFNDREKRLADPLYALLDLLSQPPARGDADDQFWYGQQISKLSDELYKALGDLEDQEDGERRLQGLEEGLSDD